MNIAFVLIITFGALVVFWGTYCVFYKSNRAKALEMYAERQQTVFFVTYDLLQTVKNQAGKPPPFANILYHIENQLSNAGAELAGGPPDDTKKGLVGYGNVVILFGGEYIFANGPFTDYFIKQDRTLSTTNHDIDNYIKETALKVSGEEGVDAFRTGREVIGNVEYLVTTGVYRLYKKDITLVMYAGVEDILSGYGFYTRFRQYAIVGTVLSITILLLGAFLLSGLKKQGLIQAELIRNEQNFENLFNLSSDAIIIHNVEGKIIDANVKAEELTGFPREELFKKYLMDLRYDHDREEGRKKIDEVYKTGVLRTESVWKKSDGSKVYIEVSASVVDRERGLVQGIVRDVTARKSAEEALRESEEYFRLMFDNSVDPILWADPETGRMINCNKSAEMLLERDKAEIMGMHLMDIHPREHAELYKMLFVDASTKTKAVFRNVEVVTKSGARIPVNISSSAIVVRGRKVIQGIFQDVTDLKKAQEERDTLIDQLNHAQKLDAVGRLAGGIAHDFNNILATISGTAELMLSKTGEQEPDHKRLTRIIKTSMRARDLTMKLLTFARKEKLNIKAASINAIVADVMDILKGTISKKIKIDVRTEEGIPNVSVDVNQVIQALLNICLNACDAIGEEGVLTIETKSAVFGTDDFQANPEIVPGKYCVVRVIDTGPGIPDHIADKVFEPFFTTKEEGKGSGLGLAVTHGIVQSHSGHISVSRSDAGGAVLSLYLPASGDEEIRAEPAAEPRAGAAPGKNILVVDDDADFLEMIRELLEEEGYGVYAAGSGAEAVSVFAASRADIDLVILDMRMPEMDGADLFYRLKETDSGAKFLVCSGFSVEGKATTLLNDGAGAFIQKPFESRELLGSIRELLG